MKKKTLLAVFAALTIAASSAALASCDALTEIPVVGPIIGNIIGVKKEAVSLNVKTKPSKMEYIVGEKFDPKGMEVEVVYKDGSTELVTDYTYDIQGALELKNTSITITWGELKTVVRIKISDPVVKVEKASDPTDLEYGLGEKFNPAGMQLKITYHSGKEETVDASKLSGIKYSYDESVGLTTDDAVLTVEYAGFEFKLNLQLDYKIYVEAEYGLLNGAEPDSSSTNNGGNYGMDAALANAQEGAQQLFEAQLKADFALAELKKDESFDAEALAAQTVTLSTGAVRDGLYNAIIEWIAANGEAVTAYTASDEYKAAVEAYLASTQYEIDTNQYRASNDIYLGGLSKGSIVTFSFEADKAGKSDIAFRMSSAWLYEANSWNPIVMHDVQFNVLCEFYVNGIKYDIPDDIVLEGGRTADGSTCQNLWVNWQEVEFDDIDVVSGRNVVELRVLNHKLVSPAQPGYSFSANVDSLVIVPQGDLALNPYRGKIDAEYAATSAKLVAEGGKAQVVIEGTVSGVSGYAGDLVNVVLSSGSTANAGAALVKTGDGKFSAVVDVTEGDLGSYRLIVDGKALKAADVTFTAANVSAGANSFKIAANEDGEIVLTIDSDTKIVVNSATMPDDPVVDLRQDGDKVYVVIGGGTVDYVVSGYTAEEAKPVIEEAIVALFYMDFQRNGGSWDQPLGKNFHTVNLLADNKFEIVMDVTNASNFPNVQLMLHFVHRNADGSVGSGGALDFKPEIDTFEKAFTVGSYKYTFTYDKSNCFGLSYLVVSEVGAPRFSVRNIALEERDGKATLVLTGTHENCTEELMNTWVIDGEVSGRVVFSRTIDLKEDGSFEVVVDINEVPANGFYYLHAGFAAEPDNLEEGVAAIVEGKSELTVGTRKYVLGAQWSVRGVTITAA